jgi:predicted O-methyltransferase YrrM
LLGNLQLAVSPETGTLLYLLVRSSKARSSIEFGASIGISTLHLAAALRDNGGGRLVSTEFEPSKIAQARANIAAAGLSDLVEIREGDALETLARDLLDGAKALYPPVLALLEARLRPGAMIVGRQRGLVPRVLVNSTSRGRRLPCSAICKRRRIVNDGLSIAARQSNPTTKRLMR